MAHLRATTPGAAPLGAAAPQRRVWHCAAARRLGVAVPPCVPRRQNPGSTRSTSASASTSSGSSAAASSPGDEGQWDAEKILFFASGNAISLTSRRRRTELWPEHHFSREDAVQEQLKALQQNNHPYIDHGVEVMYRFADFDPFNPRTLYFGRRMDLGQFERFRRIMHTPPYVTLLGHASSQLLSTLEVSEHVWVARVEVTGAPHGDLGSDVATYEFTMVQRVGGVYDGYWFTQSLVADGNDWQFMRGPPPSQAV